MPRSGEPAERRSLEVVRDVDPTSASAVDTMDRIAALLAAPAARFSSAVHEAHRLLGELLGADRVLTRVRTDAGWRVPTEWCAPGVPSLLEQWHTVPGEPWEETFRGAGPHDGISGPTDRLPPGSALRSILEAQGVRSCALLPAFTCDGLVGGLALDAVHEPVVWSPNVLLLARQYLALYRANGERVRRERAAQRVTDRYFQLTTLTDSVFAVYNLGAPVHRSFMNPRAQQLVGDHAADWTDHPLDLLAFVHPDDRQAIVQAVERLLHERPSSREAARVGGEIRLVAPRGSEPIWLRGVLFVLYDHHEQPAAVGFVGQDVTGYKQLQAELTAARDEAQQATQMQREFLSHISHELRTPLHSINGYTQLLEMTELTDRQRDFAARVHRASDHLTQLVDDLLTLGRAQLDPAPLELVDVPVREALYEVAEMLAPSARQRDVTIEVRAEDPLLVSADAKSLRQVLVNLAANACKFTDPNTRVVLAATGDDERIRLTVTDSGPGIDAARLAKLFRPFERAGASDVPGTGLGLVVAKSLTERMGGRIEVQSTPGCGSTFAVVLARSIPSSQRDGDTVLIVDDDPQSSELAEFAVRNALDGVRVRRCSNGADALALVAREQVDALVLDRTLPDALGEELLPQLRAAGLGGAPVVIATADATLAAHEAFRHLGVVEVFVKPLDLRRLGACVRNAIESAHT